jgi:hypothetical protein
VNNVTMAPAPPRTFCAECGDLIVDSHAWVVNWWQPLGHQTKYRHVICDASKRAIGLSVRRKAPGERNLNPEGW